MDRAWWKKYHREARDFQGLKFTACADCFDAQIPPMPAQGNSGAGAIALAATMGAQRIILLGYDCKYAKDGKRHWHGDHPKGLGNAASMPKWAAQFEKTAAQYRHVEIVNASRETALRLWPRVDLDKALSPRVSVYAVLKSGGWCGPEHAQRLAASIPGLTLLTDMDVPGVNCVPLKHGWQGWWSKLELCRPDIDGDVLYFDLDTLIYGDVKPLMVGRDALLGDFYKPRLESGVMYLTEASRRKIWKRFTADPKGAMKQYRMDGKFFADCLPHAADLRKLVPGIHSYKVHGKRADTRVLCFHGKPRPDETELWQ